MNDFRMSIKKETIELLKEINVNVFLERLTITVDFVLKIR